MSEQKFASIGGEVFNLFEVTGLYVEGKNLNINILEDDYIIVSYNNSEQAKKIMMEIQKSIDLIR